MLEDTEIQSWIAVARRIWAINPPAWEMQITQGFLDGLIDRPLCNSESCFSIDDAQMIAERVEWICKVNHAYHKDGHVKWTL